MLRVVDHESTLVVALIDHEHLQAFVELVGQILTFLKAANLQVPEDLCHEEHVDPIVVVVEGILQSECFWLASVLLDVINLLSQVLKGVALIHLVDRCALVAVRDNVLLDHEEPIESFQEVSVNELGVELNDCLLLLLGQVLQD